MSRARAGDIVSRRKGLVMHKGVALGDGRVLHNTPFRGEHVCTESEFRDGKRMYVERREGGTPNAIRARIYDAENESGNRKYNLLTNNCEHTVSRVTDGKAKSPQLRSWVVGTGLAAATFAITRHPVATAAAYAFGRKLAGRK